MATATALPPLIESVPVDAFGGEASQPAQKRRGRPPKLNPDGSRVNPASGARRPSTARKRRPGTRSATATGPRSLAPEITAFLSLANAVVIMSPLGTRPLEAMDDPNVMPTHVGDELDAVEIHALAASLDAQCRRSPRFRKYVEGFLTAGASGQLVGVLAMIAARRAARHGIVPAYVDPMLGGMMGGNLAAAMEFQPTPEPDTAPNENGEVPPARDDATIIDFSAL